MHFTDLKVSSAQDFLLLGNCYVASRALHVVADQKIADLFENKQPQSIEMLVKRQALSPIVLKKVLRVLSSFGIFKEHDDGTFSLEEVGQMLRSDHPSSMRNLLFCEDCRWNSFGQMSQSLKSGETGFSALYRSGYFDYIAQHPQLQKDFDDHMKAVSAKEDPVVAQHLPLKDKLKIVDVGGGKGGLISAILDHFLDIKGGIFELAGAAEQEIAHISERYGSRIDVFTGSFFDPLPFKSDAIVLKRVLHDWDDEHCVRILTRCREALSGEYGEIYIVESLLRGKEDSSLLRLFDLLLFTVFGGVERSIEEYEELCHKAGLQLKRNISTPVGMSILVINPIL